MRLITLFFRLLLAAALGLAASGASAQAYPTRPIRILASDAGGGSDIIIRQISTVLNGYLGQQLIIENHPGGVVPPTLLAHAPPDGYTLLYFGNPLWLVPLVSSNVPYDPIKDFAPITAAISQPTVLVVHPSLPVKTVRDLFSYAKARPGQLNYAASPAASAPQLSAALFKSMAHIKLVEISYKGGGAALNDVIGGQVHMMFVVGASATPQIKAGRLRALGVSSLHAMPFMPGVPAIAEAGVPGYEFASIGGLFAPAKTPPAIVTRLSQETVRVLNTADIKRKFADAGIEVIGSTPEQFAAIIKSEMEKWGKIIKEAGIRAE